MSVIKSEVNLEVSFDQPAFTLPGTTVIAAMGVEYSSELVLGLIVNLAQPPECATKT